jgi:selenocysteine lyase/cysteine desulfurase
MQRRNFLKEAGLLFGGTALLPALSKAEPITWNKFNSWAGIREQFLLDPGYIHMAQMLLASHPKPVRDEIEMHRKMFDTNPAEYWENNFMEMEPKICGTAGAYMNADAEEIVLTDSTSMGLGLLYTGFKLKPDDEILTTTHDHFATEKSLEYAAAKNGAVIRRITLYKEPFNTSAAEITDAIAKAIQPSTRIVAVTWVHSCTGVKLPLKEIGAVIQKANERRAAANKIYFWCTWLWRRKYKHTGIWLRFFCGRHT